MSEQVKFEQSVVGRYVVLEVHPNGRRVVVWYGRGEKGAIRECDLLNRRLDEGSAIHYLVEEERR